jgi:hypothetical protein
MPNWPWARLVLGRLHSLGASHPDGFLYFFDQESVCLFCLQQLLIVINSRLKRLFTDTDMFNPKLRKEMEDFYILLQRILACSRVGILSNNYNLTLDITPTNDGRITWSYYYTCFETRCLSWLHPYDTSHIASGLTGIRSPAHISVLQTSSAICYLSLIGCQSIN